MIDGTAGIGNHYRHTAGPCFGGDHAEGFRLAPVHKRIGAGEDARKAAAVAFGAQQPDMGIAGNMAQDGALLAPFAEHHEADRHVAARRVDCIDHHRPALFGGQSADREQQRGAFGQFAFLQQAHTQCRITQGGREASGFDTHGDRRGIGDPAFAQTLRQIGIGADDVVEPAAVAAQVLPEHRELTVDGFAREDRAEPAIGIGRQRIRMHHKAARGRAGPVGNEAGAAPGGRRLDEVGCFGIKYGMQPFGLVEVPVLAVERKARAAQENDAGARAAFDHCILVTGGDDHDLVAELRADLELLLDIRPHTAAARRIEGAYVHDLHR